MLAIPRCSAKARATNENSVVSTLVTTARGVDDINTFASEPVSRKRPTTCRPLSTPIPSNSGSTITFATLSGIPVSTIAAAVRAAARSRGIMTSAASTSERSVMTSTTRIAIAALMKACRNASTTICPTPASSAGRPVAAG